MLCAMVLIAATGDPSLADLNRLFASDTQPDNATAYLLAAALISDIRRTHGAATPGAIAERVGTGTPFRQAFAAVTGEPSLVEGHAIRGWFGWGLERRRAHAEDVCPGRHS